MITTLAACPPGSLYDAYLRGLRAVATYVISDENLIMNMKMGGGNLAFSNQPIAAMNRVTGTVTHLQRIALSSGAIVTVTLVDISRKDAPAIVLAQQVINTGGKQAPFAFELAYDLASIDARFTYAVQARITGADGRLIFVSDTVYPVITRGNPNRVDLVLKIV